MLSFCLFFSTIAFADVPPEPPAGKQFATHSVEIQNLKSFADYVIYVGNKGKTTNTYRVFDSQTDKPLVLAQGSSREGKITNPQFLLMTKQAFEEWSTKARQALQKQREDCMNGIGCAHISRFEPTYPSPSGIDCNIALNVQTTSVDKSQFLSTYKLEKADDKSCVLKELVEHPVSSGGCSTTPANGFWALWLVGLAYLRRNKKLNRPQK